MFDDSEQQAVRFPGDLKKPVVVVAVHLPEVLSGKTPQQDFEFAPRYQRFDDDGRRTAAASEASPGTGGDGFAASVDDSDDVGGSCFKKIRNQTRYGTKFDFSQT